MGPDRRPGGGRAPLCLRALLQRHRGIDNSDLLFGLCSDPAIEFIRLTYTDGEATHTAEAVPGEGGLFLYHCPEGLREYDLYTAQALDGQGQVLYTVTRSTINENELI